MRFASQGEQDQHEGDEEERKIRGFDIATYFEITFKDFQGDQLQGGFSRGGVGGGILIYLK